MKINFENDTAVLVIDMLEDFVREGGALEVPSARGVIENIRELIGYARRKGSPVIFICDSHEPDDPEFKKFGWPPHAVKGTTGAKIIWELEPQPGDKIVEKKTYSGFFKTNLEGILNEMGIKKLVLTGCVTHICVLFTASDAVLRGFEVSVVEKGVAGLAEEDHQAGLRIMKNVLGVKII